MYTQYQEHGHVSQTEETSLLGPLMLDGSDRVNLSGSTEMTTRTATPKLSMMEQLIEEMFLVRRTHGTIVAQIAVQIEATSSKVVEESVLIAKQWRKEPTKAIRLAALEKSKGLRTTPEWKKTTEETLLSWQNIVRATILFESGRRMAKAR